MCGFILSLPTVVVDVCVASVAYTIVVRVVLVQIRYCRTVVASVSFFVGAVLVGIQLVRVGNQRAVVLAVSREK